MTTTIDGTIARSNGLPFAQLAAVLLAFVLVALFGFGPLFEIWYPLGHAGIAPDANLRIYSVLPGGAGQAAGIKAGDRIDPQRFWPNRARYDPMVYYFPAPGSHVSLPLIRGSVHRTVDVTTREVALESVYRTASSIVTIFALLALSMGALLVLTRSGVMTWALFVVLVSVSIDGPGSAEFLSPLGYWWVTAGGIVCVAMQALWAFVVVFAIRIPNDRAGGWMIWGQRFAIALFFVQLAINIYPIVSWELFGTLARNTQTLGYVVAVLICTTAVAAIVQNVAVSDGKDRHRMSWVISGGLVWATASLVRWQVGQMPVYDSYALAEVFAVAQSIAIALVVYGIIRSRVVDVTFVISRAVVLSLLTGTVILLFGFIDWLFNKKLEATRLGSVTEFVSAISLGIWLDHLHKRADALVDRLFFRDRYIASQRLDKAAQAILHADTVEVILEFLVDEPYAILKLGSAAVFQPNERGDWRRIRASGWENGSIAELSRHDALILHVESEQAPVRIHEIRWPITGVPQGAACPVLAVPVLARHRVLAIALYGEHVNGADLDGDEVRAIAGIANAAGAAFDHVEAADLRRQMEALRRELSFRSASPNLGI